jgi:hypothetical protein
VSFFFRFNSKLIINFIYSDSIEIKSLANCAIPSNPITPSDLQIRNLDAEEPSGIFYEFNLLFWCHNSPLFFLFSKTIFPPQNLLACPPQTQPEDPPRDPVSNPPGTPRSNPPESLQLRDLPGRRGVTNPPQSRPNLLQLPVLKKTLTNRHQRKRKRRGFWTFLLQRSLQNRLQSPPLSLQLSPQKTRQMNLVRNRPQSPPTHLWRSPVPVETRSPESLVTGQSRDIPPVSRRPEDPRPRPRIMFK